MLKNDFITETIKEVLTELAKDPNSNFIFRKDQNTIFIDGGIGLANVVDQLAEVLSKTYDRHITK